MGYAAQPRFLNLVAVLETSAAPLELLAWILEVERELGRERSFRNAPRTLDVDLLLYGDRRVGLEGLTVPHPRMSRRAFVLAPLVELAPDLVEPGTGVAYATHLERLLREAREREEPAGSERARGRGPAGEDDRVRALAALGVRRVMDGEELLDGE